MSAADRDEPPLKAKTKGAAGSKGGSQKASAKASLEPARKKADLGPFADDKEDALIDDPPVVARETSIDTDSPEAKLIAFVMKHLWLPIALILPVAIVVGLLQGAQAVLLLLIALSLIAVISLFWSSLRTLLGETPLSGADAYAIAAPRAEEEQKQAILRALKDLEFERSVGKISDEDYAALVAKYRGEAKRLLRVIEEEARPRRERVEWLVQKRLAEAGLAPKPEIAPPTEKSEEDAPKPTAADEKKAKKKGKSKPIERPQSEVEIIPLTEPALKPKSEITLKSTDPPLPTKTKESPAYVPPTKTCGECGTKNDPDANFCKKCGSKTFEKASAKVTVGEAEQAVSKEDEPAEEAESRAAEEADLEGADTEKEARS